MKLFIFQLRVSNMRWKRISIKILELITGSVTRFRNSRIPNLSIHSFSVQTFSKTLSNFVDRSSSEMLLLRNDSSIQPVEFSGMNCLHVNNRNGKVCAVQKHIKWRQLQRKQISTTLEINRHSRIKDDFNCTDKETKLLEAIT